MGAWHFYEPHPNAIREGYRTREVDIRQQKTFFHHDGFYWHYAHFERPRSSPGFFVELGTNHYKGYSLTYFAEQCMGWRGVCVEANSEYHADIRSYRTCSLVPQ